jgi:hypothetical protein
MFSCHKPVTSARRRRDGTLLDIKLLLIWLSKGVPDVSSTALHGWVSARSAHISLHAEGLMWMSRGRLPRRLRWCFVVAEPFRNSLQDVSARLLRRWQ